MMVCGIPQFVTEIRDSQSDAVSPELYGAHLTYLIYFILTILVFLLNCICDKLPTETTSEKQEVRIYSKHFLINHLMFI